MNAQNKDRASTAKYQLPSNWLEVVRWLHADLPSSELLAVLKQLAQDQVAGNEPRICITETSGELVTACYFRILFGSVATLGSTRARNGSEKEAAEQIAQLYDELHREGIKQIQAIVDQGDVARIDILKLAGFELLTHVKQLLCVVRKASGKPQKNGAKLSSIHEYADCQIAKLIEQTFVETLDCPALNGLRDPAEVLQGFLEGSSLKDKDLWFVLQSEGEAVGLLLLAKHNPELYELCYMGVIPSHRGNGWGQYLVEQSLTIVAEREGQYLALGVDAENIPALRVYNRFGFMAHQTKAVLFHKQDLARMESATDK